MRIAVPVENGKIWPKATLPMPDEPNRPTDIETDRVPDGRRTAADMGGEAERGRAAARFSFLPPTDRACPAWNWMKVERDCVLPTKRLTVSWLENQFVTRSCWCKIAPVGWLGDGDGMGFGRIVAGCSSPSPGQDPSEFTRCREKNGLEGVCRLRRAPLVLIESEMSGSGKRGRRNSISVR